MDIYGGRRVPGGVRREPSKEADIPSERDAAENSVVFITTLRKTRWIFESGDRARKAPGIKKPSGIPQREKKESSTMMQDLKGWMSCNDDSWRRF